MGADSAARRRAPIGLPRRGRSHWLARAGVGLGARPLALGPGARLGADQFADPVQPARFDRAAQTVEDLPDDSMTFKRKAAERTIEGLWTRIAERLPAFSPSECKNYFAAAGYDAT